jgi:FkbM family methyltransferase
MNISNIQKFGASVQQGVNHALQSVEQAKQTLSECHRVLTDVMAGVVNMDIYTRGHLRARIWELEQMFGHKGPFLSATGQDQFIYETFFKRKKDGVYLEIGGYNGWRGSNCYFFEKTLGWRGVIVEASPTLVRGIGDYRNARIVHAAIADKNGVAEFMDVVSGATQMGGLVEHYVRARLDKVRTYPGHIEQRVRVPTMTLASLLGSAGLKHVDYCSIDVEGAERSILENFNFRDYDISVFSIENDVLNDSTSVKDIFVPAGYRLADVIGIDEIYVREGLER